MAWTMSACWLASAQEPAPAETPAAPPLTIQQVEESIRIVTENTALDETLKNTLLEIYNQALEQLRLSQEWEQRAAQFEEEARLAPERAAELQTSLENPPGDVKIPDDLAPIEYEQQLLEAQSALEAARAKVNDLEQESSRRTARRRELSELQTATTQTIAQLQTQESAPPSPTEAPEIVQAQRVLTQARRQAREREAKAYEAEQKSYDIRRSLGLVNLRLDAAVIERRQAEQRHALLDETVRQIRESVAESAAEQVGEDTFLKKIPPEMINAPIVETVQTLIVENKRLAQLRTGPEGYLARISNAREVAKSLEAELATLRSDAEDLRNQVEKSGSSEAVGALLRTRRRELPDVRDHRRRIKARSEIITQTDLAQLEFTNKRQRLSDVDAVLTEMPPVPRALSELDDIDVEQEVRALLNEQKRILDDLLVDTEDFLVPLWTATDTEQLIVNEATEIAAFVDERIFWVRSGRVLGIREFSIAEQPLQWLYSRRNWTAAAEQFWVRTRDHLGTSSLILCAFGLLLGAHAVLRKRISAFGEIASNSMTVSYLPTVRALLLSIVGAGSIPLLFLILAWRVNSDPHALEFSLAIARGLIAASACLFCVEMFRYVARPGGLGRAHFGWPEAVVKSIRNHVTWLGAITVPCVTVTAILNYHGNEEWYESLSRILFVFNMAAMALFGHMVLRAGGPLRKAQSQGHLPRNLFYGRLAYFLSVAVPIVLMGLAMAGYFYSAAQLAWRLFITIALGAGILVARGMILRWLTLEHRRIAIAQYTERLRAKAKTAAGETPVEHDKLDLSTVTVQTSRLTNTALLFAFAVCVWLLWSSVLPALNAFRNIELGGASNLVDGPALTLGNLFGALLIGVLTLAATRNIPGLLEITILQRLKLQAGERYAITTIVRYVLIVVGVLWAADVIGFGWSKVQWLVAALGVGIGFGLQEIVANFISGVILLFERPIRVGDTVTIGTISGKVSRIRMRATTIMDWDLKELIVPNKEFVTGQLINWSLSDTTIRVVIQVGVGYGSNTEKVLSILYSLARENPLVLKDPSPVVVFVGFGASSMDFELRAYCRIDDSVNVKHSLHMEIESALRNAGIEIAFTQQDINIRSIHGVLNVQPVESPDETPAFANPDRE